MKGPRDKKASQSSSRPVMPGVDVEQLERLLDFMAAHDLEEFEYEHEGLHIRLRKAGGSGVPAASLPRTAAPSAVASSVAAPPAAVERAENEAHAAAEVSADEGLHLIKSPIVGTFYGSPSPDAASFVKEGDTVRAGQVVCIVEAMKLMNEIEADIAGEVVRVLVENKQPVEYGQPLFSIRPGKKK